MQVIPLMELDRQIDQRKAELGIVGNNYAPLNSGSRRTPAKRAMLGALRDLAEVKGQKSKFKANF